VTCDGLEEKCLMLYSSLPFCVSYIDVTSNPLEINCHLGLPRRDLNVKDDFAIIGMGIGCAVVSGLSRGYDAYSIASQWQNLSCDGYLAN
jgi:hypothetical protein